MRIRLFAGVPVASPSFSKPTVALMESRRIALPTRGQSLGGGYSFGTPFNGGQVARGVDDAHNLRPVLRHAVKGKPTLDDDRARFRLDFRSCTPKERMILE